MNYNCRRAFVLAMTCLLCVAGYPRASTRATSDASSDRESARLIVRRMPNLGNNVVVQLYVDNVVVGSIGFGHTYEGFLKPGHHVLSALATPRPRSWERPPTMVDARSGQTYTLTAMADGQGSLILRPVR